MSAIQPLKVTVVFRGNDSSGEIIDGKIEKNGVKCESFKEFILHGNTTLNSNPSGYHYSQLAFYCNDQLIILYDGLTNEYEEFKKAQGTNKIRIAEGIVRNLAPPVLPSTTTSTQKSGISTEGQNDSTQDFTQVQEQVDSTQGQVDSTQESVDSTQGQVDSTQGQVDSTQGQVDSTQESVDLTQVQEQVDSTQGQVDSTQGQVDSTQGQVDSTEELNEKLISLISLLGSMSLDSINEMEEQNNVEISKKLSLLAYKFLKQ